MSKGVIESDLLLLAMEEENQEPIHQALLL